MKKKILGILICGVLVLSITGCGDSTEEGTDKTDNNKTTTVEKKISCSLIDDSYIEEVIVKDNILTTKIEKSEWQDKSDKTCEYYKNISETFNAMNGIVDTVTCDSTSGKRTTTYTISELDSETKLDVTNYISSDGTFDLDAWKEYKINDGYTCTEN